ncbi:GNAT family N-acetyltransferase [Marinomonas mediterranea]|nr:GNAT family N-acetyltransferase [Marinomonas mediterranea]
MEDPYSDEVFRLTKSGLFPYVDEVFGWDDEFQKQRMLNDYEAKWFHWVYSADSRIGYVCFRPYDQALHLHLIVLDQNVIGQGLGKKVMDEIHKMAADEERDITLSSFRCNERAVKMYESLNYEIIEEEEHFLLFRKSYNKTR